MWNKEAIENHLKASALVCKIKNECGSYISDNPGCTEYEVTNFMMKKFKDNTLRTDEPPMVAFRENTNKVHYQAAKNSAKTFS